MTQKVDRREFLLGSAALCAGCAATRPVAPTTATKGEIRIVHCGDPQFGFSKVGDRQAYFDDLARFERTISRVNALRPDLCFIAGDMVHSAPDLTRDWPRLLKQFEVPVVAAPGNHDMGQSLTAENADRFAGVFGYEYASVKVGRWRFISGNSQYWRPTDETSRRDRYEAWLKAELEGAKSRGEPVILGTHVSPFMRTIDEADDYENCPKADRARRFYMYLDNGVKFHLCGHTHRAYTRAWEGIRIFNAETTCRNFDGTPLGFRLFTVRDDGSYSWDFHGIG